ncbi:MAG: translation initiation factor IF-2 [Anaerolineae bacterium]|nr:translation initiation factor IF-2 [Anaerolineae bacterium]
MSRGLVASPRAPHVSDAISGAEPEEEERAKARPRRRPRSRRPEPGGEQRSGPVEVVSPQVVIPDSLTVRELANLLKASPIDVIKVLMANGVLANINQPIDFDTAAVVAAEMGFEAREEEPEEEPVEEGVEAPVRPKSTKFDFCAGEDEANLRPRPPIVTVLGHVDHGKTTLLDAIRQTNVVASEAGGITQRIGAYQVEHGGSKITFIDTPGHEAFTAMRARGAQATDLAVLVVAADDGVMPQTREAIDHARAAQVPIVVALNKVDLPGANPDRVKQQLAEIGLAPDEWGGDTLLVEVSALRGEGIDELLEAITLQAEALNCRANPDAPASGTVIESTVDRSRGPLATLLVQNGTLHRGDVVVVGTIWGRVRAMFDENGNQIRVAPPATPVQVMGLSDVPPAGSIFQTVGSDREAKELVAEREEAAESARRERRPVSLEDLLDRLQAGETEELNLIVKTDAQGSIEPVVSSLERLERDGRRVRVLHASTGSVGESDVNLAIASDAIIIGFNVAVDGTARRVAEGEGVEIRTYDIIYHLIEDVERLLAGMAEPTYEAVTIGQAEVRQVFQVRSGTIAGCYVTSGRLTRNAQVRVIRGGEAIWEGGVASLRRFTEDVREVREGFECGVGLDGFSDLREGDVLEAFVMRQAQ